MKRTTLIPLAVAALVLLGSGITIAQFIEPVPPLRPGGLLNQARPEYEQSIEIQPGQSFLIHGSDDIAVEVYVDVPISVNETLTYENPVTGRRFVIPNQAAVRLQGPVVISRGADSATVAKWFLRWRYVDTMFNFSRNQILNAGPAGR